ncbi:MAG: nucleoside triphosphatase NudI [Gammaproteobacteria bacterium]|jgi:nucleoside triphosphatase
MKIRNIVVPIIQNQNEEYLICKMPKNRGVFPGQWGLPGGGMEPGEQIYDALRREIREELGITVDNITPWTFRDDLKIKTYSNDKKEEVYMIYLIFDCLTKNTALTLNDEFDEYAWVKAENLADYNLNEATRLTFKQKNIL